MNDIKDKSIKFFWVRGKQGEPIGMIAYRWPIEPVKISDGNVFEMDTVFTKDSNMTRCVDPKDANAYIVEFAYSVWDKRKDSFNRKIARVVSSGRLGLNLCRKIIINDNHPIRGIMRYLAAGRFPIIYHNDIFGFEGVNCQSIDTTLSFINISNRLLLKHSTPPHKMVKAARLSIPDYHLLQDVIKQVYYEYSNTDVQHQSNCAKVQITNSAVAKFASQQRACKIPDILFLVLIANMIITSTVTILHAPKILLSLIVTDIVVLIIMTTMYTKMFKKFMKDRPDVKNSDDAD